MTILAAVRVPTLYQVYFGVFEVGLAQMAVFKQWYRKLEGQYLHSKSNGAVITEKSFNGMGVNDKTTNGTVKGTQAPKNEIETTVDRLVAASKDLNTSLRKRKIQVSGKPGSLDVPLTEENSSFHESKSVVLDLAEKLVAQVKGPRDVVLALSFEHCASASLQIIMRYRLHHHVPLVGFVSYEKVAKDTDNALPASLVERILKHAISFGLFTQPAPGLVAHNSASSELVRDSDLEAWVFLCSNVAYPAGAVIPKAIDQYGASSEANEAAYGVSIGRKVGQFERFREPGGHRDFELFAKAMKGVSKGGAYDAHYVVESGFPWSEFGKALVVDVGGGPGHVSVALARQFPELIFEVQDLPETVEVGRGNCPVDFKERITFKAHNFFEAQPARSLSPNHSVIYFLRFILHDWSDKYAQQILAPLAKTMRPQDRLVLNEAVVPEPGEKPLAIEKGLQ
ncbi:MAG: hypothetical protein Q9227_009032 [Pyrenula ochraceoflavens]